MRRFEAVDRAEGGGDADAASTVTSKGYWDKTCADCIGATAGGAAGVVLRVVWIWRCTFEGVVAGSI